MIKALAYIVLMAIAAACGSSGDNDRKQENYESAEQQDQQQQATGWEEALNAVVKLDSYDDNRILETGQGFFIADNLVVTKFSLVNQANNIKLRSLGNNKTYTATSYVAFDRINDLIILKAEGANQTPVELYQGTAPGSAKTMYIAPTPSKTIQLFTGKMLNLASVQGNKLYRITNKIRKSSYGAPVFVSTKKAIGLAFSDVVSFQEQSFAIPSFYISDLLANRMEEPKTLESLRSFSNEEIAAENKKIKALVLETDMGDITIRLFNSTPAYRDNFVKLVKEDFYDSLLIHRVITDFGIQTGAADTRYAEKGDIVGWKGPGYTVPAHIVPELFHKRGMIGSPRKPDTKNERRRSDGSQFYIVSGRRYFDAELDEIEERNNHKFTPAQRQAYKTVGGAPHLDGSYTIFGEVISGMDVVDRIVGVETDNEWRPLEDIRLKNVRIIR